MSAFYIYCSSSLKGEYCMEKITLYVTKSHIYIVDTSLKQRLIKYLPYSKHNAGY